MKKKSFKKKMVIALAGIILAGSMGWNQIPVRAAVNGDVICAHSNSETTRNFIGYKCLSTGHMEEIEVKEKCTVCKQEIRYSVEYGNLEPHKFRHFCVEELDGGMYKFEIECTICGYEDEVLSDDPSDPHI